METAKTFGIACMATLVILAICNRVDVPLLNPRMTPPPSTATASSAPTTGGA